MQTIEHHLLVKLPHDTIFGHAKKVCLELSISIESYLFTKHFIMHPCI